MPSLILLLLTAPFTPLLEEPPAEGWTIGQSAAFTTSRYEDDAGIGPQSLRLEFRRDDAGYGSMAETVPYTRYHNTSLLFPVEGTRWCWRASYLNTLGQSSAPSSERCFRTDLTKPTSPAFVDAGAITSTGRVQIEAQPATDALSGVRVYFLELAATRNGAFYSFPDPSLQLPIDVWLGEGNWFGWLRVEDFAGNNNRQDLGVYAVPINVTASASVPVPEAPVFARARVSGYGDSLAWDAGWMLDAGVTHVVASFCNLSTGCEWRHGFHSIPVTDYSGRWLQVSDEGTMVARVAVVQGGQVGRWSASSTPVLIDRTPPPIPSGLTASPSVARQGPVLVSWNTVTDSFTGLSAFALEESALLDGGVSQGDLASFTLSKSVVAPGDGRYQFRVASRDATGNQSGWSAPVVAVIDGTGPLAQRPTATASPIDGGALVSISWAFPIDALSAVTLEDLKENAVDGGAQVFSVTGLAASRIVPPGQWSWALRGTDALGNVGNFGEHSNIIVVTEQGVVVGPSIVSTQLTARCGEALVVGLVGSGDDPLRWTLLSGPPGLLLSELGQLEWTPAAAGTERVRVRLTNPAGFVEGELDVQTACGVQPEPDAGVAVAKSLGVGCGCASFDASWCALALLFIWSRRRTS